MGPRPCRRRRAWRALTASCTASVLLRIVAGARVRDESRGAPRHAGSFPSDNLRDVRTNFSQDLAGHVLDFAPFRYQVALVNILHPTTVYLWGRFGRQSMDHGPSQVDGIQFFPLGDRLLSWSDDGTAVIWDTATRDVLRELKLQAKVSSARIFPRGDRVVMCTRSRTCTIWDTVSGGNVSLAPMGDVYVDVSPSGDRVLTWGASTTTAWTAATGKKLCQMRHHYQATVAKALPMGHKVVIGRAKGRAIVWDTKGCYSENELSASEGVRDVAVVAGGDYVAGVDDSCGISVWRVANGMKWRTLVQPLHRSIACYQPVVVQVEAFPSDDRVATMTYDGVRIWNATSGAVLHRLPKRPHEYAHRLSIPPGGDIVATLGDGCVKIWDADSGSALDEVDGTSLLTFLDVGVSRVLDPVGFGRGVSWRGLSWPR